MGFCFDDIAPTTIGGPCGFLYPTLQRNFFENPNALGTDLDVALGVNKVVYFSNFFFDEEPPAGVATSYEDWVTVDRSDVRSRLQTFVNQYFPIGTEKRNILDDPSTLIICDIEPLLNNIPNLSPFEEIVGESLGTNPPSKFFLGDLYEILGISNTDEEYIEITRFIDGFLTRLDALSDVFPDKGLNGNIGIYFGMRGLQEKENGVPVSVAADYSRQKAGFEKLLGAILNDPFSPLSTTQKFSYRRLFQSHPKQIVRFIVNSDLTPERQLFDQVINAVDFQNISYTNSRVSGKFSDHSELIAHVSVGFNNNGGATQLISEEQLGLIVNGLCQQVRGEQDKKIFQTILWASPSLEPLFYPQNGVISDSSIPSGAGTNPTGGYNGGGLFNLELFNTTGCELPPLPLPADVLELLEAIATGELFRNPLEGLVNSALGAIGDVVDSVVDAIPSPELPGRPGEDVLSSLQSVTDSAQQITNEFNDHCARLSGVSNYREGFEPGGGVGDLPGLAGLQAIAQQYNQIKNVFENDALEQALIDQYSPFFSSILGPGDQLYESFNSLIDGDLKNFLPQFPVTDGRLDLSQATVEQLTQFIQLADSIDNLVRDIQFLIDSDNATYFAAADYLAKKALGFSVLTMMEDPCFSQKLLGQIAKPDLKGLLNL